MMKHTKFALPLSALLLLTGCASYQASALPLLTQATALQSFQEQNVHVMWKIFDRKECKTYLDRDILAKGYIPVHLTFHNESNDPLSLSPYNFSAPVAPVYEVAHKVHTSTAGRALGWGLPGLMLFPPLVIPGVVDGVKSFNANKALDHDYELKSIKEQVISPHATFNCVAFVPEEYANQAIHLHLVNQKTGQKVAATDIILPMLRRN